MYEFSQILIFVFFFGLEQQLWPLAIVGVTISSIGTVGVVGTVGRFLPLWTRMVTHLETSRNGRCLLSISLKSQNR